MQEQHGSSSPPPHTTKNTMLNYPQTPTLMHHQASNAMPGNPYVDVVHRKTPAPKPQGWTDAINNGVWSDDEHQRFMDALRMFPGGPWRLVAEHVGTRTVRQVQTHMQKINEKARRHRRGLHKKRKERPHSEPIGHVSASASSSEEEMEQDDVIFEPIVFSPRVASTASTMDDMFSEDGMLDAAMFGDLDLDGMEDVLGLLLDDQCIHV